MTNRLSDEQRMYRAVPERDVVRAVLDYAERLGAFCWRVNTGAVKAEHHGKTRFVRFAEPGTADIFCVYRGRFIAIETKTETGKQSQEQRDWQHAIEAAGGIYRVCRPSDYAEVIDAAIQETTG